MAAQAFSPSMQEREAGGPLWVFEPSLAHKAQSQFQDIHRPAILCSEVSSEAHPPSDVAPLVILYLLLLHKALAITKQYGSIAITLSLPNAAAL